MILTTSVVPPPGAEPRAAVLFLHGILGSGPNLRSHAAKLVAASPRLQAVLVDLRAHGGSLAPDGQPDTLEQAALDLEQTAASLDLPVQAVVGHSFGGKVALAYAQRTGVPQVMTLDAMPGTRPDARGSETTAAVLTWLEDARGPWPMREHFVRLVETSGLPGVTKGFAQWLAMNLTRTDAGFVLKLSLPRIRALLESYLRTDLWPVVEQGPSRCHLVIGERAQVYAPEDRERALRLAAAQPARVTVDFLPAGHWVHVDDPDGLSRVLAAHLVG